MPTRNVVLTHQQENFLATLVTSGAYQNASEVLREGLRLLENKCTRQQVELANIQAGILTGLDQIDQGQFATGTGEEAIQDAFEQALSVTKHKRNL